MKELNLISILCIVVLGTANLKTVFGLNENAVKEFACISPGIDKSLNWTWVYSTEKFYFPLWSKLELYRFAEDIIGKKISDISEEEIKYPCSYLDQDFTTWCFNRPGNRYVTKFNNETKVFTFQNANGGKKGKYYMTLTDNENFIVGITCWEDNQASWTALTTKPTVDDDTKKVILDYVKSKGFNLDLLVEDKWEDCDATNFGKVASIVKSH